jgi:alkylation response protein AidB-like acyl-CoA dehydrogenase
MSDPDLDAFDRECDTFLSRYPKKAQEETFEWGVGSDRTAVFEEIDPEVERIAVAKSREWRWDLWEAGLGWITGPPALGGRGLQRSYQSRFDLKARRYEVPGNAKLTVGLGIVVPTILEHGSDSARATYPARIQRGELIACQLFSEPSAGSDLASVSTKAVRHRGGWRLTGQKVWTSGAQFSDIGEALCRSSDGPRHRNLTAFVLNMHAPGVSVRPLRQMTGGASFNEVFLDDVWVPDTDRLGDVDGGWVVAMTTLANERAALGDAGFGGAGLFRADRYIAMFNALAEKDDLIARQQLANLITHLRIAKYTRQRVIDSARSGKPPGPAASIAKLQLTSNFERISAFAAALLGASLTADDGRWGTYAWNELVLGVPGIRLGGGTDEINKNVIAERVLGLPRE